MRLRRWLMLVAMFGVVACACGARAQSDAEQKAQQADAAWLTLVDDAHYGESWKAAAAAFQAAVTQEGWERQVSAVRGPLGKVKSRKLMNAKYATSLPGAPDGEYVVCVFASSFEHKASAQETVAARHEPDGAWRVTGYFIK